MTTHILSFICHLQLHNFVNQNQWHYQLMRVSSFMFSSSREAQVNSWYRLGSNWLTAHKFSKLDQLPRAHPSFGAKCANCYSWMIITRKSGMPLSLDKLIVWFCHLPDTVITNK
jgi:hypothetical protein